MKRHLLTLYTAAFYAAVPATAQLVEPKVTISPGAPNSYVLTWEGAPNHSYFVRVSTDAATGPWSYAPVIEHGEGELSWGFNSNEPHTFVQLKYTNAAVPEGNPDEADFDNDGASNFDEISVYGTDPFQNNDADGDGLTDSQEALAGTNPHMPDLPEITVQYRWRQGNAWKSNTNTNARKGSTSNPTVTALQNYTSTTFNPVSESLAAMNGTGSPNINALNWLNPLPNTQFIAHVHYCAAPANYTAPGGTAIPLGAGTADCRELEIRLKSSRAVKFPITKKFLQLQRLRQGNAAWVVEAMYLTEPKEFGLTIPKDSTESPSFYRALPPWTGVLANGTTFRREIMLLPVSGAPDILASNMDYDEGDYSDPHINIEVYGDSQNSELVIRAEDVNSVRTVGQLVTDDLHRGWFGVLPGAMEEDFWNGSTVTIRKVPHTNPTDGLPEEGNVRFFATTGQGNTLSATHIPHHDTVDQIDGKPPTNLVGIIYGSAATVPANATLWMEGVFPGYITLEWRYQKGITDRKYEQTFEITTRGSVGYWQEIYRQRMFVESRLRAFSSNTEPPGVDIKTLNIPAGFMANRYHVAAIYNSYGQTYLQNETAYLWMGLAKRAGAPVYAGLSDAKTGTDFGVANATKLQEVLMEGMRRVHSDMGWQFVAYQVGGLRALEFSKSRGDILSLNYDAWKALDTGRRTSNTVLIAQGNESLADQEQSVVLATTFRELKALRVLGLSVPWLMSIGTESPVPGGPDFRDISPDGDITNRNDRWNWLVKVPGGLFDYWNNSIWQNRKAWVNQNFFDAADDFDFLGPLVR
jgi:hypothetical protein